MAQEITDIEDLFERIKLYSNDNKQDLNELHNLESFCGENEYELEHLKDDFDEIREEYAAERRGLNQVNSANNLFDNIKMIMLGKTPINYQQPTQSLIGEEHYPQPVQSLIGEEEKSLIIQPKHNKVQFFMKRVNFQEQQSNFETRDEAYILVDNFIPDEYRYLRPFEKVCCKNQIALSEYLVTGYHESGLSINEYIGNNELFNQLNQNFNLAPTSKNINKSRDLMVNYLIEYEKSMAKPLPSTPLTLQKNDKIRPFKDDINIIVDYMNEINNGLKNAISNNAAYPIHLDVFFVAPNFHNNLDLHSLELEGTKSDKESRRNGAVNASEDMYRILRRANDINKANKQRFIMLIVRANIDNSADDTVYLYKPDENNSVAPKFISDSCELTYLIHSKSQIVPGLNSTDPGVLGWNHHLHSGECNKVYLSYGNYKSRVFKDSILHKLQCLFDQHNGQRHKIGQLTKADFMNSYQVFTDKPYVEIGEYWFNNNKRYQCYEPYWNPTNCRAMGNVFIPKKDPSCTQDLLEYIDEKQAFESVEKLYYKLDYTVGMQICDKQTVCIKFYKTNKLICLLNTELHKNGQPLYAVIEKNSHKSKQKWKIIDYQHISEAFMTPQQLIKKYKIFKLDLPSGSRAFHNGWGDELDKIHVTKQLIRNTNWSHIRIVQSRQNISKMGGFEGINNNDHNNKKRHKNKKNKQKKNKGDNNDIDNGKGALRISERRFKQLALKALQNCELTPIAHFKFRKNKYHLEKLLPVRIPEHNKYVAISFWFNELSEKGRTQASGVCLDLIDMKNKANLIEIVPQDSWLNKVDEKMTINNLNIGQNKKYNKKNKGQQKQNNKNNKNNNKNHNQIQNKQQQNDQQQPQPPLKQALSPVESIPSAISSPSPNMIMCNNNNNNNINMSEIAYEPFKVPTSYQPKLQQQQQPQVPLQVQPQSAQQGVQQAQLLNFAGVSTVPQSVPQLFTFSSISSASSQLTPPPIPSISSTASQSSIPSNISSFSSVPNVQPNLEQYQQQIPYFASFLNASSSPPMPTPQLQQQPFINTTVSTTNSFPVANCYYNTASIAQSQANNLNYNQAAYPSFNVYSY